MARVKRSYSVVCGVGAGGRGPGRVIIPAQHQKGNLNSAGNVAKAFSKDFPGQRCCVRSARRYSGGAMTIRCYFRGRRMKVNR